VSFQLPLVFAAWGFRKGGGAYANAGGLAQVCVANGIRTVAVQLGYQEAEEGTTTREDADTLRSAGLKVAVWGVADAALATSELQRLGATQDDWLPQIEGPGQRDLVLDAASRGLRASGIVSNYSGAGDSANDVPRLRDAGVRAVFVECYNDAGPITPYTDLDRMLWQGTQYGWKDSELVATMGTYHGEQPDAYTGTDSLGRDFGLYLAEPMVASQWEAFGALNEGAPPTPTPEPEEDMDPITDDQARASVKTVTQAALSAYTGGPKPKGRNTIAWRIANADDGSWNAARDGVKSALDKAGVPDVPA